MISELGRAGGEGGGNRKMTNKLNLKKIIFQVFVKNSIIIIVFVTVKRD